MNCLLCGSPDIRLSKRSHLADVFARMRGKGAFRCRSCGKRFYAPEENGAGLKQALQMIGNRRSAGRLSSRTKRHLARKLVVIAIFAAAFALFWFCLRFIIA